MDLEDFKKRVHICFKSNDVRCIVGKELDSEIAYRVGRALVSYLKAKEFVVGHDMRVSSHALRDAFIRGIRKQGGNVIDVGKIDSPGLYFASGFFDKPGGMITASHNPAKYNGIKLVRSKAIPIGDESGLRRIRAMVLQNKYTVSRKQGRRRQYDLRKAYRKHVHSFVKPQDIKGLRIVIDAGNGMAGRMVPAVFSGLSVRIIRMHFRLDGRFPNHEANPAKLANIRDLMKRVKHEKADFGIAFDGDMDRVFFVDERGKRIDSSLIAALLVHHFCSNKQKARIVYNSTMSWIVPESAKACGGKAFVERVGHAHMKARMKRERAVFGAENSAHYYYRDNWNADSGLITSLIVCALFAQAKKEGKRFSDLVAPFRKYAKIFETSLRVADSAGILAAVEKRFAGRALKKETMDGLTLTFDWGWFNIRASNTEPLLRVNLEARTRDEMLRRRKEVLEFIRSVK